MKLKIGHLYPDLLDLYGDRGNILTLTQRAQWRGIEAKVQRVSLGDPLDFSKIDILFIGGGSDREQDILVEDLMKRKQEFKAAIEDGLVVLAICGGYQLLGQYYQMAGGKKIPGLGFLDLWTEAGSKRLIGNVVVKLENGLNEQSAQLSIKPLETLVGFENHSGKTFLGNGLASLGQVLYGNGNNGEDGAEGMHYKNVFGTYLHGPLLPKNPHFTDLLIALAFERSGSSGKLAALDDQLELLTHQTMVQRILNRS
ncbi:type 1 glutamine amidotransferase [Desulfitobacterium metallireducens]|uniref:Lipid II isoglutaminyl synthase (glutamine-hydrolyzing) subunit GatD n=1 Tax=Desulfitobacterium metallireducens DSM 15288 TaxID=871968 RepID=W0EAV1_9FIRM|nr:glutamine amidotransferase [Desulfitobacterium metallireducens]AHF06349.1 glutamine amidotransferase [Desulfitobacterium metallireducens DSM 15288]